MGEFWHHSESVNRFSFQVQGLPPKKDGANSMWRKGTEMERLKALRVSAFEAMREIPVLSRKAWIWIVVHADARAGDLDNFITGVCDGLMAAHPNTVIDGQLWVDVPAKVHPNNAIALSDDSIVEKIRADRKPSRKGEEHYSVFVVGR